MAKLKNKNKTTILKNLKIKRTLSGYSLVEMVVTLLLTSIILLGLITLLTSIMNISAMSYNRNRLREDLQNFVLTVEKDLRNARRIGKCEGENQNFNCEFFTDALYRWQSCDREIPDYCKEQRAVCIDSTYDLNYTMCKYKLDSSGNPDGDPIVIFDGEYNLEYFGLTTVADEPIAQQSQDSESSRKVLAFTAVASHPNKKYKVENIIRQSIVSTKNFELVVKNDQQP